MGFLANNPITKAIGGAASLATGGVLDAEPEKKTGFMSLLGDYAKSRMPIMYGLGNEAFGKKKMSMEESDYGL